MLGSSYVVARMGVALALGHAPRLERALGVGALAIGGGLV
jgi:hypothetical protein